MTGLRVITPAEMGRMLDFAARLSPWAIPVLKAIRGGDIGLSLLQRDQRAPLGDMRRAPLPVLAWIPDDDDLSCGPDRWRPALAAARWARTAVIHAAGGEREHYELAVAGAVTSGRMLLIETASRHADAWSKLLAGKPTLIVLPRGGVHPIGGGETRH